MDKKFIYYSSKIKPGSHTNARARQYMHEQHQHIQMQMQMQVWTHCHGLHLHLHLLCEPRQCKCKDKKTSSIGFMTPWPSEVESKIAYSILDEKLTKSVHENIRCFMINIVQINWRKLLPEKMWQKKQNQKTTFYDRKYKQQIHTDLIQKWISNCYSISVMFCCIKY